MGLVSTIMNKVTVFYRVMPSSLVLAFRSNLLPPCPGSMYSRPRKVEAVGSSEAFIPSDQTARCHITQDRNINT